MDVASLWTATTTYVFNRGEHPMMVFDSEGNFLRSWGEDLFTRAHGIHIGADDMLYCTDDGDHTVRKITTDGVQLEIGGLAPCRIYEWTTISSLHTYGAQSGRTHLCGGRLRQRLRTQVHAGRQIGEDLGRVWQCTWSIQSGA